MHTKNDAADIFRQLAEGVGNSGSPRFYATLVERLATILGVDHVLVADVTQLHQSETLAVRWGISQQHYLFPAPLARPRWGASAAFMPVMFSHAFLTISCCVSWEPKAT